MCLGRQAKRSFRSASLHKVGVLGDLDGSLGEFLNFNEARSYDLFYRIKGYLLYTGSQRNRLIMKVT